MGPFGYISVISGLDTAGLEVVRPRLSWKLRLIQARQQAVRLLQLVQQVGGSAKSESLLQLQ